MFVLIVANLMSQDTNKFIRFMISYQGIKKGNTFLFTKTSQKGIGLAASFGSVHDHNALDLKSHPPSIVHNLFPELPILKRGKGIEQRQNNNWSNILNAYQDKHCKSPGVKPAPYREITQKQKQASQKRQTDNSH